MKDIFEKLSFKQKIVFGFSLLSIILILGMGYMLLEFTSVSNLSTNIIEQHQPVTRSASNVLKYSKSSTNFLHEFLLNSEPSNIKNYHKAIENLELNLNQLIDYAENLNLEINNNDLLRSLLIIEEINLHVKDVEILSKNYEENRPLIKIAALDLNPLALEYLGLLNWIIQENTDSDLPREVLIQLIEMRHSWTQMMSSLRITLATKQGKEFINFRAYADVNKKHIDNIIKMNLDASFEEIKDLETIRKKYMVHFERLVIKFNASIWRMDAHIMTSKIMPLFDELETYLNKLSNIQLSETKKADMVLTKQLEKSYYSFVVLIILGLVFSFFISSFITRSLRKPLVRLVAATEEVAKGNFDTGIDITGNDEIAYLNSTFNDMVRKLKESQLELITARDIAEHANQAKSQFLARMSHELRTPLNAILGFAQILEANLPDGSDSNDKEYIEKILASGWHLLELVEEVLDLTRIESNTIFINVEKQNIFPLIQESIEIVRPMIEENKLILVNKITNDLSCYMEIDPLRFKQIIINLLTNAVKFNRLNGKVTMSCDFSGNDFLRIKICDEGSGLTKTQQHEVFEAFQRLDADKKAIAGTGIGLNITKNLVELMDGFIGIESEPGEGSCFWVEFPAEKMLYEETDEDNHKKEEGRDGEYRVLYVEDDEFNMQLIKDILSLNRPEFTLLEASSAEDALDIAAKEQLDLILMDINLPGMSGQDALIKLQESKATKNIPVIAVSADAVSETITKGIELGFKDYITKPIKIDTFLSVVDAVLKNTTIH